MNIAQDLLDGMSARVDEADLYAAPDGTRVSAAEFRRRVARRAADLAPLVAFGEMVIVASGRGLDFFVDMFALWSLGAVAIPYSPADGPDHLRQLQRISGATRCLADADVGKVGPGGTALRCVERDPSAPCVVLFTSGSTGHPKGVVLSQQVLLGNALSTHEVTRLGGERLFVNVPFHFTSCICHFLSACLSGASFIGLEAKRMYADFVQAFVAAEATALGGAPVQFRWLAEASGAERDYLERHFRFAFSSGDHLPDEVSRQLRERYPRLRLFTAYGLTELGGRYCILRPEETPDHPGSVGRPIPGLAVRIVDSDTGALLPPGEEGEVVASGRLMADGYLNDPEETAAAFRAGSFFTGDLGHLDNDGFLQVTGRASDVFKVNGKKVSALTVAAALMSSGRFADAAVIGKEVPVFGTVPIACCVLRPGTQFEKGPVLRHLREHLPNSHIPHEFVLLDAIPRTGSGKVKRAELRTLITRK